MNPVAPIDGRGRIREGAGPGRFERLRFRNVAVPDVDLMTVLQRAAHEAATHQTRAEKCNLHDFSPAATHAGRFRSPARCRRSESSYPNRPTVQRLSQLRPLALAAIQPLSGEQRTSLEHP